MSKVSINESNWINLVFEGKNKEYGAYQMRLQDTRTTLNAFFLGLFFIASLFGLITFLSSFGEKPKTDVVICNYPILKVTKVQNTLKSEPKKRAAPLKRIDKTAALQPILKNPIITPPEDASDIMGKTNPNPVISNPTGSETGTTNVLPNSGNDNSKNPTELEKNPVGVGALDKLPEFPGGIAKFYAYVGTHFEKPEIDDDTKIRVDVSFVIEIDGTITDIQVKKNPGYGMDKEAIRVLKSLKTKWTPGMIGGKPVRTSYMLPIIVQLQ